MVVRDYIGGSNTVQIKSLVVAGRCALRHMWGKGNNAAIIYLHFIDAAALPADGVVTHLIAPLEIPINGRFDFEPKDDLIFNTGICIYASSTQFIKTLILTNDLSICIQYKTRIP